MSRRNPSRAPLNKELETLDRRVREARGRERQLQREHELAKQEVVRLADARIQAFADHDDTAAQQAQADRAQAEERVAELAERAQGAAVVVKRTERELAGFAAEHLQQLMIERAPQAQAAADVVSGALEALAEAGAAWTAVEQRTMEMLRLAGRTTETVPRMPPAVAALIRDARRVDSTVPPALPPRQSGQGFLPPVAVREPAEART